MVYLSAPLELELQLTDEQFFELCHKHSDLQFERNTQGDLIIMPPTGGETGKSNAGITSQLWLWNQQYKLGVAFDSSTGFKLPNGGDRSPDASWMPLEKWQSLTSSQKQRFLPLAPDFVIELLSSTDKLKNTQEKMQEYIENGTKLGWLINPKKKQIEVYRQGKETEILDNPQTISGEDILPDFQLDLELIW